MAGLEFDRQAFVPANNTSPGRSTIQLISPLLLVLALGLVGFVGYKVYLVNLNNNAADSANEEIQRLQQELGEMQKRLDAVEHRHKVVAAEPVAKNDSPAKSAKATAPARTVYRIAAASAQPATPVNSTNSSSNIAATRSNELEGQVAADARQAGDGPEEDLGRVRRCAAPAAAEIDDESVGILERRQDQVALGGAELVALGQDALGVHTYERLPVLAGRD